MGKEQEWAIIQPVIWGSDGSGYCIVPGRRYKSAETALRGWQRREDAWNQATREGKIHPDTEIHGL